MSSISTPDAFDKSSASFNPTAINVASTASFGDSSTRANLESIIQETKIGDDTRTYVDMYWTDAHEKRGDASLFGKTPKTPGSNEFVSICAVVTGNQHNLFVLPAPMLI